MAAGVIDPTKVTRTALQNAASIASLMLTTEAMIADIPEKKQAPPMPATAAEKWITRRSCQLSAVSYRLTARRRIGRSAHSFADRARRATGERGFFAPNTGILGRAEAARRAIMTIEIRKPELERLVREEILSGRFKSVDDLITEALQTPRKAPSAATQSRARKNLA